jgi:hypothetical protein
MLAAITEAAGGKRIEVWFEDEARVGQKNGITRRWARRGTRPVAAQDQRTASAYIFGAICPAEGKAAAIVVPRCNTAAALEIPGNLIPAGVTPDSRGIPNPPFL